MDLDDLDDLDVLDGLDGLDGLDDLDDLDVLEDQTDLPAAPLLLLSEGDDQLSGLPSSQPLHCHNIHLHRTSVATICRGSDFAKMRVLCGYNFY